jgi:membrane protein YqaA with SNARE-associated domain
MERTRARKFIIFIVIVAFIAFWSSLAYFVGPEAIVDKLGAENGYILIFFIALLGGVSVFTSPSYFAALITFGAGGLDPFILAALSGLGVAFGDALFFYLGVHARKASFDRGEPKNAFERAARWIEKKSGKAVPILVFLYSGFTPFPNDVLAVSLAFANYPFKKFFIAVLLGNINLAFWVAFLASKGIELFG